MRCKNKGFGLIELLVVMGVIAIISAVATPSILTWRANAKLRSAAADLRGAVQLARSRAVQEGKTVIVDLETDNYFIFVDRGDDSGGSPNGMPDPEDPLVYEQKLPAGIQLKFRVTKTGEPAPPSAPEGGGAYSELYDLAKAGGLFELAGWDENSPECHVVFYPWGGNQWAVFADQAGWTIGFVEPTGPLPDQIIFDPNGRCLNPQSVILVNVNGKKMLLEVTRFGVSKVTKVDDDFGE